MTKNTRCVLQWHIMTHSRSYKTTFNQKTYCSILYDLICLLCDLTTHILLSLIIETSRYVTAIPIRDTMCHFQEPLPDHPILEQSISVWFSRNYTSSEQWCLLFSVYQSLFSTIASYLFAEKNIRPPAPVAQYHQASAPNTHVRQRTIVNVFLVEVK